ncbi:glycoside hydrolase family 25 protein [Chitinophaga sp. RAB17]|uniref:glycoside hydrolase family 25 protein n=1 Tax=Chitinophaga sp. RAB17 TaxID=3233049 RepID=UPI003F93F14A
MQLIVTVKKLNKRNRVPAKLTDKSSIIGTVLQGFKFEGTEVKNISDPSLGKWYKDRDGYFYWGGGLMALPEPAMFPLEDLPINLPENYLLGADVSHYNSRPDWDAMIHAGISFVYIKISEGVGTPDQKAKAHAENAHANGLKTGYYHFCRPDTRNGGTLQTDAIAEANAAVIILQQLPEPALPLVLDLEDQSSWDTPLSKKDYLAWIEIFIQQIIQSTGVPPVIYSRKEYLDRKLPKDHTLGKYHLWLAAYSIRDANKLKCPVGWQDWSIWQFSEKAHIGGNAMLDLNIMKDLTVIIP